MGKAVKKTNAEKQILKKHVSAIHIGARLTLLQRKLVNALLYNAYETLLTEKDHTINTRLLCEMIGFESKNVTHLKKALKGLMETVVEFDVMEDDGKQAWEAMVLLPYAKIQGGTCTYRYEQALAEKLYHPDVYSKLNLSVLREMKSAHALILYENCHRYLGSGQTAVWELDVFRKLMALENRYQEYKFLKRDVIMPAIKEVNAVSNILLELRTIRTGRAVSAVQFVVNPNPQTTLFGLDDDDEITQTEAYTALLEEGVSKNLSRSWILEYGEAYVLEKIAFTRSHDAQGKIKSSRSGFLKAAVVEDFKSHEAVKRKEKAKLDLVRDTQWQREQELERLKSEYRDLERQYREWCYERIQGAFDELPKKDREAVNEEFIERLKLPLERKEFQESGWKNRVVLPAAREFWSDRSLAIQSLEDFSADQDGTDAGELKERIRKLESDI